MTAKSLFNLEEESDETISIGLVRKIKNIPDYEFFYHLNNLNDFRFSRIDDLVLFGNYFDYSFPVFRAYDKSGENCIYFISNQSSESLLKKEQVELFSDESDVKYLLPAYEEVDYIVKTSDTFPDFSLILLPEHLAFQMQKVMLSSSEELYGTILYYE